MKLKEYWTVKVVFVLLISWMVFLKIFELAKLFFSLFYLKMLFGELTSLVLFKCL